MRAADRSDLARRRMTNQLLRGHDRRTPLAVAQWLGALQAQDLASAKWSLSLRLPDLTESDIDEAIAAGDILRTWPMRGTLHLVPAADAHWLLKTTGERALRGVARRWEYLGLDRATVDRAADLLETALRGGTRLPRSQALEVLADGGLDTSGQRGYHYIWYASQIGVTCLGPNAGNEPTLALLADAAPHPVHRDPADGLRELALRYVRSHGPVPATDLARWAGIGVREARTAITANDDRVATTAIDGTDLWHGTDSPEPDDLPDVLVLPGFDELILGYADRSFVLPDEHAAKIVPGNNGVFRGTVLLHGQACATWKRTARTRDDVVEIAPFAPVTARTRRAIDAGFDHYRRYRQRDVVVRFPD